MLPDMTCSWALWSIGAKTNKQKNPVKANVRFLEIMSHYTTFYSGLDYKICHLTSFKHKAYKGEYICACIARFTVKLL